MKIFVIVKTGKKKEYIKKIDDDNYIVAVKEHPVDGKANSAIIKSLSEYFQKPKSFIKIIRGASSKQKTVEIPI